MSGPSGTLSHESLQDATTTSRLSKPKLQSWKLPRLGQESCAHLMNGVSPVPRSM